MKPENLIVLLGFYGLLALTLFNRQKREAVFERQAIHWFIDICSLIIQGLLVPLLQVLLVASLWEKFFPNLNGQLSINPYLSFFLSFVVVDYIYYWNHRLLHSNALWTLHQLHHSPKSMDILVSSRNSLLSSFFIVYLWIHGTMFFFLSDFTFYGIGIACGSLLDLWRHSGFSYDQFPKISKVLGSFLTFPKDHGWHHSRKGKNLNFGANLNIWDRIHGTYLPSSFSARSYGLDSEITLKSFLIFPTKNKGMPDGRS